MAKETNGQEPTAEQLLAELGDSGNANIELNLDELLAGTPGIDKSTPKLPAGQDKWLGSFESYEAAQKGYNEAVSHAKELEGRIKQYEPEIQEYSKIKPVIQELQSNDDLMQTLMERAAKRLAGQPTSVPDVNLDAIDFESNPREAMMQLQKAFDAKFQTQIKSERQAMLQEADKLVQNRLKQLVDAQMTIGDFMTKHPDLTMDKFKDVQRLSQEQKIPLEDAYTKFNSTVEQYVQEYIKAKGLKLTDGRTPTGSGGESVSIPRDMTGNSPSEGSWEKLTQMLGNPDAPENRVFMEGLANDFLRR